MSNPMDSKDAAPLTAALLARKGGAMPARFTPRPASGAPASGTSGVPRAGVLMRRASLTQANGSSHGSDRGDGSDRARVTLRLDEARHFRLKLAAAHLQQSLQEILTVALDRYLEEISPEILREDCVCLATRNSQKDGR